MTLPTFSVRVDWNYDGDLTDPDEDITADVISLDYSRGARFDGSAEYPGAATLRVRNDDGRYTPDNASGPHYGYLVPGRAISIQATYSGTPYGVFYGRLRRITPLADKTAELYAEDMLGTNLGRREANVEISRTRSIADFRDAVLDWCGIGATLRDLAGGIEANIPWTYASAENALAVLEDCNRATGSIHFVRPGTSVAAEYVTLDRTALQTAASAESWGEENVVEMGGWDITDEAIVNEQRANPIAYEALPAEEVWRWDSPFTVNEETVTIWAHFSQPVYDITFTYDILTTGSATATATYYGTMARIDITDSGLGSTLVVWLSLTGTPYTASERAGALASSSVSQGLYGTYSGDVISSRFISTHAEATGVAQWIVQRYGAPKARPWITRQNVFPSLLAREVGDVVTFTYPRLSISATRYYIRSLSGRFEAETGVWTVTYGLERALELDTYLTLDVSGKGLDDAGAGTEGKLAI